jgi:hypothetical protein
MVCFLLVGRRMKKKKREVAMGFFFFPPGLEPDTPCYLCQAGFLWLLGAIKG